MSKCVLMCAPPGAGKSTTAKQAFDNYVYVNQDTQCLEHMDIFDQAILDRKDIVLDRMNFNKEQRSRYLSIAKDAGYETEIVVIHESYQTCYDRMVKRLDHPTIKDEKARRSALHFFFTRYERVTDDEADKVIRLWPGFEDDPKKPMAIIIDLDGTLCNIEHRLHHVRDGKKDWPAFFRGIPQDKPNPWCQTLVHSLGDIYKIVYCSGRGEEEREATEKWLKEHSLDKFYNPSLKTFSEADLYMRKAKDSRKDSFIKEIILDFEILTRYTPYFMIDDRTQVVEMWRSRGYTCLQCAKGNF